MVRLLIIEDELPLLRNISSYLESFREEFEVATATTGEEGLELLRARPFDVLLTDVRLPGIDGIEVIRRASSVQPRPKLIVMTAFVSPEVRDLALSEGAVRFIEKPLDLAELRRTLKEEAEAARGWKGTVGGLDIFDFTQLLAMSGKSKSVRVTCGSQQGIVVFENGNLTHASAGELAGEEAFYRMAGWEGGTFEELPGTGTSRFASNLTVPTPHLLMAAATRRDERRVAAATTRQASGGIEIRELLGEFQGVKGFRGAAVLTAEGEVVEQLAGPALDTAGVGKRAAAVLRLVQEAAGDLAMGKANLLQLRMAEGTVMLRSLDGASGHLPAAAPDAPSSAVVVMDTKGNIGMATVILDRLAGQLAESQ